MPHLQQSKSDATFAAVLVGQPIAHLVHVGHDGVGRVAHDGTEHSGDVTWEEVKEISGVFRRFQELRQVSGHSRKVRLPAANVTTSCSPLLHSALGLGTT